MVTDKPISPTLILLPGHQSIIREYGQAINANRWRGSSKDNELIIWPYELRPNAGLRDQVEPWYIFYQPLLRNIPAHARPMNPMYPTISPALFSPASIVPMTCSYLLKFVSSVLKALCRRISDEVCSVERGGCRRCDSIIRSAEKRASRKEGHTRSEVYESKSDSTYIPFRSSTYWFVAHTLLQTSRSFHCVGCLIGYSPSVRQGTEGISSEERYPVIRCLEHV